MAFVFGALTIGPPDYKLAWEGDEQPVYDIEIGSSACGTSTPAVQRFNAKHSIFPIRIACKGATPDARQAARQALLDEVTAANATHDKLMLRSPGTSTPQAWTILGAVPKLTLRQWDGTATWFLELDIYAVPTTAP